MTYANESERQLSMIDALANVMGKPAVKHERPKPDRSAKPLSLQQAIANQFAADAAAKEAGSDA